MSPRLPVAAVAVVLLVGCAAGRDAGPEGIAYLEPDPNPATYTFHDSATFAIEAPGLGLQEVATSVDGVAVLRFRSAPDGYVVRVRFPRLEAAFTNPPQGSVTADEGDIDGPVDIRLSDLGEAAVVDTPSVSATLREITGVESLVRPLFLRLPGREVGRGDRWTDTVRTREEVGRTVSVGTRIVEHEVVGDTVVGDRSLVQVRTEAATDLHVTGAAGGVELEQRMEGSLQGVVLWDPVRHILVEREESGELTGTLEMLGTGVGPLPVTARVRRGVSLRPSATPATPGPGG